LLVVSEWSAQETLVLSVGALLEGAVDVTHPPRVVLVKTLEHKVFGSDTVGEATQMRSIVELPAILGRLGAVAHERDMGQLKGARGREGSFRKLELAVVLLGVRRLAVPLGEGVAKLGVRTPACLDILVFAGVLFDLRIFLNFRKAPALKLWVIETVFILSDKPSELIPEQFDLSRAHVEQVTGLEKCLGTTAQGLLEVSVELHRRKMRRNRGGKRFYPPRLFLDGGNNYF
jgi:hypothetical protein